MICPECKSDMNRISNLDVEMKGKEGKTTKIYKCIQCSHIEHETVRPHA